MAKTRTRKRYKDIDGLWLRVSFFGESWRVAWHNGEHDGYNLGEISSYGYVIETLEDARACLERRTCERATKPLASGRDYWGFVFATRADAKAALDAANKALLAEPLLALDCFGTSKPAWAIAAHLNGWKPPKGWKP